MWRGGCIIKVSRIALCLDAPTSPPLKSVFLKDITSAYEKKQDLESLLFDDFFNKGLPLNFPSVPNFLKLAP